MANTSSDKKKIDSLIAKRLDRAKKNYETVEKYYQELRNSFIQDLNKAMDLNEKEVLNSLSSVILQASNQSKEKNIESTVDLFQKIAKEFVNIDDSAINNLKEVYSSLKKTKSEEEIKADESYKAAVDIISQQILSKNKIIDLITEFLNTEKRFSSSFNTYDISQFIGKVYQLKNNVIADLARGKSSRSDNFTKNDVYIDAASFFIKTSAGFYNEAAVYDALMQLTNHVKDNCKIEIFDIGGKNTHLDELIRINYPSTTVVGKVNIVNDYGVQAKSWDVPWDKHFSQSSKDNLTLSHNTHLLNLIQNNLKTRHSWSNSVLLISEKENMIEATDNALLWKTGHDFIWADTMIEQMKNRGYYVNFRWKTKSAYEAADDQLLWHQRIGRINYSKERGY